MLLGMLLEKLSSSGGTASAMAPFRQRINSEPIAERIFFFAKHFPINFVLATDLAAASVLVHRG